MIFVILGSQRFQFNRLLEAVDHLAMDEEVFAQIGYSDYVPRHYVYRPFLDKEEFDAKMEKAEIIITHGGSGSIMNAVKKGKKVIAVPRLAKYGEHVDDHQVQLIEEFGNAGLVFACKDMHLERALLVARSSEKWEYISNTKRIIDSLAQYIDACSE